VQQLFIFPLVHSKPPVIKEVIANELVGQPASISPFPLEISGLSLSLVNPKILKIIQ
jgi:hypothetical protein